MTVPRLQPDTNIHTTATASARRLIAAIPKNTCGQHFLWVRPVRVSMVMTTPECGVGAKMPEAITVMRWMISGASPFAR